jgi:cyclophilin family peptidyl-prolyl cis-trans isomerase/HEAT repeat protein
MTAMVNTTRRPAGPPTKRLTDEPTKCGGWCTSVFCLVVLSVSCATPPPPSPPVVTWEEKLEWILRLEDQRILRDPDPPPPIVLVPATKRRPAIVAPPPPSDLLRLMRDPEARVRRRAALAAGRVGLTGAIESLTALLTGDEDFEVRQMAAFALGLIGDTAAQSALLAALNDANPIVQGRAAQALGLVGERTEQGANAVSAMVQGYIKAGALQGISPDDLTYPLAPNVEAVRLGLYALVQMGMFAPLAAATLDGNGQPVSNWWPIAYAIQRLGDPKGIPALQALLKTEGRFTAAFAARGLGVMKAAPAAAALRDIVRARRAHPAVVVQSIRALALIGDGAAAEPLEAILREAAIDQTLRVEALTALGTLRGASVDLLLDLVSDRSAPMRAAALRALAATDPDTFLSALSGLDPDRDWTVRAALAGALAQLPAEQAQPRLMSAIRDQDQRVVSAVIAALATVAAPGAETVFAAHLKVDDFVVRASAANALAAISATGAVPALTEAYRVAQKDNTYVARAATLAALAKLDPQGSRALLTEALQDRDWAVRVRAADLLRTAGEAPDPNAIRPAPAERALSEAERKSVVSPRFSPHVFIETDRGTIEIELAVLDAPITAAVFADLARRGFFNGLAIHRVVPDFVVQDGDPRGDGEGGPGFTIRDEINERPYLRGTVGMALDWRDTGGSQFFITHSPQPHLDARYTVFGHVVNGMAVVDRIEPRDVIRSVRVWNGDANF